MQKKTNSDCNQSIFLSEGKASLCLFVLLLRLSGERRWKYALSSQKKNACFCSVGGHPREEWPEMPQWFRQKNSEGTVEYSGRRETVGR